MSKKKPPDLGFRPAARCVRIWLLLRLHPADTTNLVECLVDRFALVVVIIVCTAAIGRGVYTKWPTYDIAFTAPRLRGGGLSGEAGDRHRTSDDPTRPRPDTYPNGRLQGYTMGSPANIVVASDEDAAATIAHEIAHNFGIGDAYDGGRFSQANPPPD